MPCGALPDFVSIVVFTCVFRLISAPGISTKSIQMKSNITLGRGSSCIGKIIIWKKNGGGNTRSS